MIDAPYSSCQISVTKGNIEFNAHESGITRMIYPLGQAILSFSSLIKSSRFERTRLITEKNYKQVVIEWAT